MAPKLKINVTRVAGRWSRSMPGYVAKIKKWSAASLPSVRKGIISIVLADNAFMHNLNHTFRGKDKATNVLAFPGDGEEVGDIILAYETVKDEAKAQGKSFTSHTAHLVVHGCLHLLGHDHKTKREAESMEALEIRILKKLGFSNPYEIAA